MKYFSHLNTAADIIRQYKGQEPFSYFIKQYFSQSKKYGSRDRRSISHCCYCFFRLGKTFSDWSIEEKIVVAIFLCATEPSELLAQLKPAWNELAAGSWEEKIKIVGRAPDPKEQFPVYDAITTAIDQNHFVRSHLQQPSLFLRTRPGCRSKVMKKLEQAGIAFSQPTSDSLELANNTKLEDMIAINQEAVIQDLSSQGIGELMQLAIKGGSENQSDRSTKPLSVWDCCAASGGKSILLHDLSPEAFLMVTDLRSTILSNLKKRFEQAGITNYKSQTLDLAKQAPTMLAGEFDLILADLPCSGSGTWGRTPEQLVYFKPEKLDQYAALQKNILTNAVVKLKRGGWLLYSTCSVFSEENERIVEYCQEKLGLTLIQSRYFKGYDKKADTLFGALFQYL